MPYPVKSYGGGYKSGNSVRGEHSSYGSSSYGSSAYDSGNVYDSDSSKSNSLSSDDSSGYSASNNVYGKYSPYGKTGVESSTGSSSGIAASGDYMTGSSQYNLKEGSLYHYDGSSSAFGMPSGSTATKVTLLSAPPSKSTLTSYSPYASAASNLMNLGLSKSQQHNSYPHPQSSMKDSPTENYFYSSVTGASASASNSGSNKATSPISDDYGTRINSASLPSTSTENAYQIAPVYQGPNGHLYSNGQLLSKEFLKSNTVVQALPLIGNSKLAGPFASASAATGNGSVPASTNMNKNILQQYSAEIEEAKKWFSGIPSKRREDSTENASNGSANASLSGGSSSSSEEDSSLEKEKGKGKGKK